MQVYIYYTHKRVCGCESIRGGGGGGREEKRRERERET